MISTTSYYAPPWNIRNGLITLPPDESAHAARVLRHRAGDRVQVVDGCGTWYLTELHEVNPRAVRGRILEMKPEVGDLPRPLILALGALKQGARFETFLEKAVEPGVSRLLPLYTERTEKTRLKPDRLNRIAITAMKQCGRSRLRCRPASAPRTSAVAGCAEKQPASRPLRPPCSGWKGYRPDSTQT